MASILFHTLFDIRLRHEFYDNGLCPDLSVVAAPDTLLLMQQYGMLLKKKASGAVLIREMEKSGGSATPKFPVESPVKLRFYLLLQNPIFLNFTDLELASKPECIYYFSNLPALPPGSLQIIVQAALPAPVSRVSRDFRVSQISPEASYLQLETAGETHRRYRFTAGQPELVVPVNELPSALYLQKQCTAAGHVLSQSGVYVAPDSSGIDPFGVFEVFLNPQPASSVPVSYLFNFQSRSVHWRYKLFAVDEKTITGSSSVLPRVEHDVTGPAKLAFQAPSGTNPLVINSVAAIRFKEKGVEKINLKRQNTVLVSNLPNPSPKNLKREGNTWLSEVFVYYYV